MERNTLEASLGDGLRIGWHPTLAERWRFTRLGALGTSIRLRAPETLPIHQDIIDWDVNLSPTKIPAGALGLNSLTLKVMRWALADAKRNEWLNRLGGPVSAALEMDYLPFLLCSAIFTLRFAATAQGPRTTEDLLQAGIGIQRFWLTAAQLGLAMQPALAVLAFAHYGKNDDTFTKDRRVVASAQTLAKNFRRDLGAEPEDFVFMGRIGEPIRRTGVSRSVRKPVAELIVSPQ